MQIRVTLTLELAAGAISERQHEPQLVHEQRRGGHQRQLRKP
jgi:hypothetical protein